MLVLGCFPIFNLSVCDINTMFSQKVSNSFLNVFSSFGSFEHKQADFVVIDSHLRFTFYKQYSINSLKNIPSRRTIDFYFSDTCYFELLPWRQENWCILITCGFGFHK